MIFLEKSYVVYKPTPESQAANREKEARMREYLQQPKQFSARNAIAGGGISLPLRTLT